MTARCGGGAGAWVAGVLGAPGIQGSWWLGQQEVQCSRRVGQPVLANTLQYCTGDRDQDHPHGKERQESKMAVCGGLTNSCEKKRSENQRSKQETQVLSLGQEDTLEKGMATHSSILAGEFHGQKSLVGYSPWSHKEWDMTE